jgi:hypothetical protein
MGKRYVITTAVPGAELNRPFYNSLVKYCKLNKAKLLIIPSTPIYKKDELDPEIPIKSLVLKETFLNSKIRISDIPVNPQAVDPVTGLTRHSQTDGSFIFASPKQRLKIVANSNTKLPHALMTPGAVTHPYYRPTRVGMIASGDHVNGALIVEVEDNVLFHYRQVQADKYGAFIDIGIEYGTVRRRAQTEAIIPGDLHVGSTDPDVEAVFTELSKELSPRYFIAHDIADMISINPHVWGKKIARGKIASFISLEQELKMIASKYKEYSKLADEVIDVFSNHTEFLNRWLEAGEYLNDPTNLVIGLELAWVKAQGKDPYEYAMRKYQDLPKVRFLQADDDFKISAKKVQCGAHGHLGPNGSRGSLAGMERSYARSITGHSHTPEILREAVAVGTSTYLKLDYAKGPSSWMQTMCILYKNGSRQLINVIGGEYRI